MLKESRMRRRTICILEDDARRREAMLRTLNDNCDDVAVAVVASAWEVIAFLKEHIRDVALICLDHDLEPAAGADGTVLDPGTGRDVSAFLTSIAPFAPVLIHSSNEHAAVAMECELVECGWTVSRMAPYGDLSWIEERWIKKVKRLLVFG
jgi:hypothetical protein